MADEELNQEDQEFDDAFDEASGGGSGASGDGDGKEAPDKKGDKEGDGDQGGDGEGDGSGKETPASDDNDPAKLKQQLEDTKSFATKKAQEAADLLAENARLRAEKATPTVSETDDEIPDEIKELFQENPELEKAVEIVAKRLLKTMAPTASGIDPDVVQTLTQTVMQSRFDTTVMGGYADDKGEWIDGHPDAIKIVHSKGFDEWAKAEKVDLAKVSDPKDAIKVIGQYKESIAKKSVAEHDKNRREDGKRRVAALAGEVGSGKGAPRGDSEVDKDDFDGAFDEAAAAQG